MIREQVVRVPDPMDGLRFDQALAQLLGQSRGWARRVIALGGAYVGRSRVRTQSRRVRAGQTLKVCWADPPEAEVPPLRERALLHRSRGLLVVDKPAGIHCQAARHRVQGTLPELVAQLLGLNRPPEPVHRLDRGTSGVVVLSSSPARTAELSAAWQRGEVQKYYLALVQGRPPQPSGRLELALERAGRRGMRLASSGRGLSARTDYLILDACGAWTLLALKPGTGRMHQLRVHCASQGWPIAGDPLYAPSEVRAAAPRLCLHAHGLSLPPIGRRPAQRWLAPAPEGFCLAAERFGLRVEAARDYFGAFEPGGKVLGGRS